MGLPPGWWPVALTSEITHHPKAFRLGNRDLALYRDLGGVVRAVDDSCPHRRLPLSMGRLTEDGHLQCGYHGWCFDGETGKCTKIPNLREDEKIPGAIRIDAFSTAENIADILGFGLRTSRLAPAVGSPTGDEPQEGGTTMFEASLLRGLVLVWTGDEAPPAIRETTSVGEGARVFAGGSEVRSPYERVAEAVLHNPGKTLGLGPLLGAGDELAEPEISDDGEMLSVRRERFRFDLPRIHSYDAPLKATVSTEVHMAASTGLAWIESPGTRVAVGLTPIGPYRTIVRWRGEATGVGHRIGSALSLLGSRTGRMTVSAQVQADAVEALPDAGVQRLRDLRARLAERVLTREPEEQP